VKHLNINTYITKGISSYYVDHAIINYMSSNILGRLLLGIGNSIYFLNILMCETLEIKPIALVLKEKLFD
jgi:hypothetical protein